MKKKLSYLGLFCFAAIMTGLLFNIVFGEVGGWQINRRPTEAWFSGSVGDPAWNWMKDADKLIELGANLGTGKVFYVDSGVTTASDGTSWDRAVATLDAGVNLCTADRGDYILVAQGHTEQFMAQSLDIDVDGVTLVGHGNGTNCSTVDFNDTDAEIAIGSNNVTIRHMRFTASCTGVLMGIEVEDGNSHFTIDDCTFTVTTADTDEFVEAINFVNNNSNCTVRNCSFNMKAGGAAHAILCDADTDCLTIEGCDIRGDYSVACLGTDTAASTDILVRNNLLINGALVGDTGINEVEAIVFLDATAGVILNNFFISDESTAIETRVADDCVFMNNYISDTDGDEFVGSPTWAASMAGYIDANSIAGHVDG